MPVTPTLALETDLWSRGLARIAGCDSCGVGPLAGPVVAAAVILPPDVTELPGVRDSKTLSARQRQRALELIRERAVAIGIGAASVREIDRLNIYEADHLAMRRALRRLAPYDHVLLDGNPVAGLQVYIGPYTAVIKGDSSSLSIAAASVVAKVTRDRLMESLDRRYPGYGWAKNAGYGSPAHLKALRTLGPTPLHRRSFGPVREVAQPTLEERYAAFPDLTDVLPDRLDAPAPPKEEGGGLFDE